jgi:molybdenum-dependent DNA-binding transcriptional regulator ModE
MANKDRTTELTDAASKVTDLFDEYRMSMDEIGHVLEAANKAALEKAEAHMRQFKFAKIRA